MLREAVRERREGRAEPEEKADAPPIDNPRITAPAMEEECDGTK